MYSNANEYDNPSLSKNRLTYTEIVHAVNLEHHYNEAFWINTFLSCFEQDNQNDLIMIVSCTFVTNESSTDP